MSNFTYQIEKTLGSLREGENGWTKELNFISWNGREPKYDIRDWAPERERMGRGITFTKEELHKLKEVLNHLEL
jgi:hypothetical protein